MIEFALLAIAAIQFDCNENSNYADCRWSGEPSERVLTKYTVACGEDSYSISIDHIRAGEFPFNDSQRVSVSEVQKNGILVDESVLNAIRERLEPYKNVIAGFACGIESTIDKNTHLYDGTLGITFTGTLTERSDEARDECLASGKFFDERVISSIIISERKFGMNNYRRGPECLSIHSFSRKHPPINTKDGDEQ